MQLEEPETRHTRKIDYISNSKLRKKTRNQNPGLTLDYRPTEKELETRIKLVRQ